MKTRKAWRATYHVSEDGTPGKLKEVRVFDEWVPVGTPDAPPPPPESIYTTPPRVEKHVDLNMMGLLAAAWGRVGKVVKR